MERVGGGPRVKFALHRLGAPDPGLAPLQRALSEAIGALERAGCCPVLDDGLAAGNGAVATPAGTVLVSPSGRAAHTFDPEAIIELVDFDAQRWRATYRSHDPSRAPTSDAALHWAALMQAPPRLGWSTSPGASLHGHVLQTLRAAELLELPIGEHPTPFSTPADREALLELLEGAPYPEHRTVIRRDHGFFTLGADLDEATAAVEALATRARAASLLPG